MHRAKPFKLSSFEQEATDLIEKGKAHAKALLQKAIEEAAKIRAQAEREGFYKGREEGVAKAAEEEKARIARETGSLMQLFEGVIHGIEEKRRGLEANAEREIIRLAVSIAERVIKKEVKQEPKVVLENLKHAVALAAKRQTLDVRVHTDDLKLLNKYLPQLKKKFLDVEEIRMTGDPDIARGGCIVLTPEGTVDAQLRTQIEEIERQLLS